MDEDTKVDTVEASVETDAPLNLLSEADVLEDPNVELVCVAEEAVKTGAESDDGDGGEMNSDDAT